MPFKQPCSYKMNIKDHSKENNEGKYYEEKIRLGQL